LFEIGWNYKLLSAAQSGIPDCVQDALDNGADKNSCDRFGYSALDLAAQNGHAECLALLIDAGASINTKSNMGYSALDWAIQNNYKTCIKILIDHGAKLENLSAENKKRYQRLRPPNQAKRKCPKPFKI